MSDFDFSQGDYYREIASLAEDCARMACAGDFATKDDLQTWVHETIDGHQWVIYTYASQRVVNVSNNDGAAAENFGAESMVDENGCLNWAAMAYAAMEADFWEAIGRVDDSEDGITEGFDVNQRWTWEPEEEEEEEGAE